MTVQSLYGGLPCTCKYAELGNACKQRISFNSACFQSETWFFIAETNCNVISESELNNKYLKINSTENELDQICIILLIVASSGNILSPGQSQDNDVRLPELIDLSKDTSAGQKVSAENGN